jgi:uncharacterized protein YaeQ
MAIKSTIFKANLNVADIDKSYYAEHAVTLARHPSETDERMMVRLAAMALEAHALQADCRGDGVLAFGKGLSDPDEPDVMLTDYTGRKRRWIEVGQPEEKPLVKAGSQADAVHVYVYSHTAELWWKAIEARIARLDKVKVWRLPKDAMPDLTALAERSMQLNATIQDGALTLSSERGSVAMELARWK